MYTKDELEIVNYIENKNPKSVGNIVDKMAKIKLAVIKKYEKRKAR